ncbi:flagellar hook-associated protein FlgL [Oceanimonas pelagia]|uniref:Flagellar hook-associated protein FlgL n=1 Tax=Oceanimonas pelagia TaxID=3028314 RepID=A0AA50KQF0_9GAMM|nr:flagellar hook-associated protein FlgL [Oceanimonas pelagia]WMC11346.1 flagellar hook-associated protein FlgL [Oceanimonas pelagia]
MRISSSGFYQTQLNNITGKTAQISEQLDKLSSGIRVQTAADDPVAMNGIVNYRQELKNIEQYGRNIDLAENRLRREESALTTGETLLQQSRELLLKANNGANTQAERDALAMQLKNNMGELLNLANSQDEFGQYIFGGFQSDKAPFVMQPDGQVSYGGDGGQREMQIGASVRVATSHDGRLVFGQIPNPRGDFLASYDLKEQIRADSLRVEKASIDPDNRASFNDAPNYTIVFEDDSNNPGGIAFRISDGNGNDFPASPLPPAPQVPPAPYTPGSKIDALGLNITIKGEAKPGDTITLSSDVQKGTGQDQLSVFDSLNRALNWLEQDNNSASGQSELNEVLDELDATSAHFTRVRADTGNRLLRLENQRNGHEDMALTLEKVRSGMEDLDYAKATGELGQSMVALQASQTMFGKLQGMSLFNYI